MASNVKPEHPLRPVEAVDEATARVMHALMENARLARAAMLAIDRYVATAVRFLSANCSGPEAARRRTTALGLHRLEEYLCQMSSVARQPIASLAIERETPSGKESP